MMKIYRSFFLPSLCLLIGFLLCSLTGLLACGGGGSGSSVSSGVNYTLAQVDQTLTQRMGEDNSVAAVLLAMNEGYSVSQISDAIMQNRLEISGEILDSNGQVVSPAYNPLSIIGEQARTLAGSGSYDLASLVSICRSIGGNIGQTGVFVLLALLNRGYSSEQIIDALILNDVQVSGELDVYIVDADGNPLRPGRSGDAAALENSNSSPPPSSSPTPPSITPSGTVHVVVSGQGVINCRSDIRYNITIADDDEEYECENLAVGEVCEATILSAHRTVFVSYTASGFSYSHEYTYLPTTQTNIELPCIGGPGETSSGW